MVPHALVQSDLFGFATLKNLKNLIYSTFPEEEVLMEVWVRRLWNPSSVRS